MVKKKKNTKHFIIPPAYFKAKGIPPIRIDKEKLKPQLKTIQKEEAVAEKSGSLTPLTSSAEVPKISIATPRKSTSSLSLKSIRTKKAHQIRQLDVSVDPEDLPKEPVTQEALTQAWNAYTISVNDNGEKILASILQMDSPKLEGTTIYLTYSNNTNKIELERAQYPLLAYLRKTLKNFDLHLHINVNEELAKKYAFTPQEKYDKLKEKNSNIELLKQTFGLDV